MECDDRNQSRNLSQWYIYGQTRPFTVNLPGGHQLKFVLGNIYVCLCVRVDFHELPIQHQIFFA